MFCHTWNTYGCPNNRNSHVKILFKCVCVRVCAYAWVSPHVCMCVCCVYMCVQVCLWRVLNIKVLLILTKHMQAFTIFTAQKNWCTGKNPCYRLKWIWRQVRDELYFYIYCVYCTHRIASLIRRLSLSFVVGVWESGSLRLINDHVWMPTFKSKLMNVILALIKEAIRVVCEIVLQATNAGAKRPGYIGLWLMQNLTPVVNWERS